MAVVTATPSPAPAAPATAVGYQPAAGPTRLQRYRRRLLVAIVLGVALGVCTAIVVLVANLVARDRYSRIVDQGVASVDAAQDARADLLDDAGANADLLAQTDANARNAARARAQQAWTRFTNDLRRSWRNRSDTARGEFRVFDAADAAANDYAGAIGAMDAAVDANRPDDARASFLGAYNILIQRLIPALAGLQSVKLEDIRADYASTSSTLRGWTVAVAVASAALVVVAIAGLVLTRRMHYRVTWEVALALLIAAAVGAWTGYQLRRADVQAKVLVSDAYNMVANVRDEVALVSQENALESMAIFDPSGAAADFSAIDQYDLQFNQLLCGFAGCSQNPPFVPNPQAGGDTLADQVTRAALDGQDRFGLAETPLVANVHFADEARTLEAARQQYRAFLAIDADLRQKIQQNNAAAAAVEDAGQGERQFTATVTALTAVHDVARRVFDATWRSVEDAARIGAVLAAGGLVAALLLALGLWRRRRALYVSGI